MLNEKYTRVLCPQERGEEVDQSGDGAKTLQKGFKQPSMKMDGGRRTDMHTDELSSTLRADELTPHRRRRRIVHLDHSHGYQYHKDLLFYLIMD